MKLCHVTDVCLTMLLLLFSLFIQYNSVDGIQLKGHQTHHQKLIHIIIVLVNILFRYMEKTFCFQGLAFVSNHYFHFKGRKIWPTNFIITLSRNRDSDFHIRIALEFHVTIIIYIQSTCCFVA